MARTLSFLIAASVILLAGCTIDEIERDNGYYSSGRENYQVPRYYPDEMTSGYNRDYRGNGYTTSKQPTTSGYQSSTQK